MGLGCACGGDRGFGDYGLGDAAVDPVTGEALDIQEGGTYLPPDGTSSVFIPQTTGYSAADLQAMGYTPIGAASSAPVSNSALTNLEASLATQWTKIAGQAIAPQTTIQTPSGLQISTPAAQTGNLANVLGGALSLSPTTTASLGAILPWLLIGGIGLFAVKAMSK